MSLGSAVQPGQAFKQAYEQAATAALNAGCLIVAAAGNNGATPVGFTRAIGGERGAGREEGVGLPFKVS